jgi:hypothetical protein
LIYACLPLLQAKAESMQVAEAARAAVVAPLQAEVARLTERVHSLQQVHSRELGVIEAAARQQAAAAQAEAQEAINRLAASGSSLQHQLRGEMQRAQDAVADAARLQVFSTGASSHNSTKWAAAGVSALSGVGVRFTLPAVLSCVL